MDQVEAILTEWQRERPDLDPSPMAVFGRVARIAGRTRPLLTEFLVSYDLTPASFDVLANLRRAGHPYQRTPSELAESSMLSSGGITFRLDKLEADGLIVRVQSEHDRRVVFAQLTAAGIELIDTVIAAHLAQEDRMLDALTADQRAELADLLARLERSIASFDPTRSTSAPGS